MQKTPSQYGQVEPRPRTHVAHMRQETSTTVSSLLSWIKADVLRIEYVDRRECDLAERGACSGGQGDRRHENADQALRNFYEELGGSSGRVAVFAACQSHHDEVSHPIVFGHAVSVYFKDVFEVRRSVQGWGSTPTMEASNVHQKIKPCPCLSAQKLKRISSLLRTSS